MILGRTLIYAYSLLLLLHLFMKRSFRVWVAASVGTE